MKEKQARTILTTAQRLLGGTRAQVIVYPARPHFAVAIPAGVQGHDDLYYILTKYHVNHIEELEAIVHAPRIMHILPERP
jgi:hypothetical protein